MGNFEALDRYLVLIIFSRLSPTDIVLRARRVCKTWRRLTHSPYLSQLLTENPRVAGAEPWLVLRASANELLFYGSQEAIRNKQARQLNHHRFSLGPPGHRFEFVASSHGLVCGRLLDLDDGNSITLAVGNPLTAAWSDAKPGYGMRGTFGARYYVTLNVWSSEFFMEYCSQRGAWEGRPPCKRAISSTPDPFNVETLIFKLPKSEGTFKMLWTNNMSEAFDKEIRCGEGRLVATFLPSLETP